MSVIIVEIKNKGFTINGAKKALNDPSLKLDDSLFSSVNKKNFKNTLKIKLVKIKSIVEKIKKNK